MADENKVIMGANGSTTFPDMGVQIALPFQTDKFEYSRDNSNALLTGYWVGRIVFPCIIKAVRCAQRRHRKLMDGDENDDSENVASTNVFSYM